MAFLTIGARLEEVRVPPCSSCIYASSSTSPTPCSMSPELPREAPNLSPRPVPKRATAIRDDLEGVRVVRTEDAQAASVEGSDPAGGRSHCDGDQALPRSAEPKWLSCAKITARRARARRP
jgi:hypothetical protein